MDPVDGELQGATGEQVAEGTESTDSTDDTGFDEGFDNPTPTATPGPDDTEQETKAAEPKPPTMDERLAAAEALIEKLRTSQEKGLGTAFGKIGGIERTLSTKAEVDIDQADIDAMRADGFESHARALEKIRDLKVVRTGGVLTDDDKAEIRVSLKREMQIEQVEDEHPDWREVAATPEFQAWKATQSAADQDRLNNSWNPGFVIKSLTAFKARKPPAPTPPADDAASARRSRIDAAVTPRGTGGNPAAGAEDEFDQGYRQG
jgi:hypothetical protein